MKEPDMNITITTELIAAMPRCGTCRFEDECPTREFVENGAGQEVQDFGCAYHKERV